MSFVILKVGETFPSMAQALGDFEHWIQAGLPPMPVPVEVVDPRKQALPPVASLAGVVVTGSHAMVSDRLAWSEASGAWLRDAVAADVPVLGICYGHQLLAHCLGGRVGDHPGGQEVGRVAVELHEAAAADPVMAGLPAHFDANVVHRQSVLTLPEDATLLASNPFEPHQAFRIGGCAWGVQFHPEFNAAAMRGYIEAMAPALRQEGREPAALAARLGPTPASAQILRNFGAYVAQRVEARPRP